jgi:RHS repeat-associated protein
MKTTSLRARALSCALLAGTALCALAAVPAAAQTAREHRALDSNGVDLTHGDFVMAFVEGSIGSGNGELSLVRSKVPKSDGLGSGGHQWDGIYLSRSVGSAGTSFFVDKDNRYEKFSAPGTLPTGSSLAQSGAEHHYRTADGTLIVFGDPTGSSAATSTYCNGSWGQGSCSQLPLTIASPDGKSVGLNWEIWTSCTEVLIDENNPYPECSYWTRLGSVSNSFGYRIAFAYASDGSGSVGAEGPPQSWQRRTGAALYNDRVSTAVPQATTAYSYPSTNSVDVTDTGGRQWRFTGTWPGITGIRRPGAASDSTTIAYSGASVSSVTRDGVTAAYSRSVVGTAATMTVTNALNQATTIVSSLTIGRPTSITNPLNQTTGFEYYPSGLLKRVTRPEGNYVEHSYDARGNVVQTVAVPKGGSGPAIVTSAEYDTTCANPATCNQPNSTTDARGQVTDYSYDPTHGGVLTVTAPAPTSTSVRPQTRYQYELVHGEYQVTGISQCQTAASCAGTADEVRTALAHDSNGNLYWTATGDGTGALVAATTMGHDALGNVVAVDGPLPGPADTGRIRYNAARQVVGAISPDPDGDGNPLKHRAVRNSYDVSIGLLVRVEQGNVDSQSDSHWAAFSPAQAVETVYDSNARPVVSKLVSGSTVHALNQTAYDALGRPECSAQRMNPAVFGSPLPDACTLGAQGTGANDHGPDRISKAIYDSAGRTAQVKVALGTADEADEVATTFTPNGQVETVTDGENNRTTYEYDGHDRLLNTRYPLKSKGANASAPTGGTTADFEQLTYESLAGGARTSPLVVSFRNRAGESIGFGYDALGRQTAKDLPGSEPDIAYDYDLLGRLDSAARGGNSLSFEYDALGRQLSQTGGGRTYRSTWDLAGRRTRLTHPDLFHVDQDYLVTGEMTAIRENGATSGVGVLATFDYDQLGRRMSLTRGNGTVTSYGYDPVSRLESLGHELVGAAHDLTLEFGYNPASQIASTERSNDSYAWTGHGSGSTSTPADGLNRIAPAPAGPAYDARGNMIADGLGKTFGFDSENRIASLGGAAMHHDGLGRLSGAGTATAGILYETDGADMVAERNASTGAVARRHVFGPGMDEPLVWYEGSGTSNRRFFHSDERGSTVALSDNSGNALATIRYDEYGAPQVTLSVFTPRFLYTGQFYFSGPGVYHYKARLYHPKLGRFLQPDPIGYGDGMNMYAYVKGDPVNFTDSTGLCTATLMGRFRHNEDWSESVLLYSWVELDGCDSGGGWGSTRHFDGDGGGEGGSSPATDCAADPACVSRVDDIVVTGFRNRRFNNLKWRYLNFPKEPSWFVYPDFSVASAVTRSVKDRCGQARNLSTPPRPGYIALIHAHSGSSPGWPGSGDFATAKNLLIYGMFSEEGGSTGVWRMGPTSPSPVRVYGDRPTEPNLTRSGSNTREPAATEQRCK